jgi:uroporphyrinogen-III synthase
VLVLVTRPSDQAAETADLLRAAGHEVLIDPVLEIRRVPVRPPSGELVAIAVTSANAVPALADLPRTLPVFAVGQATARALRAADREPAGVASGEGRALAEMIRGKVPANGTILHPCGQDVREGLEAGLVAAGLGYLPLTVYEAVPATSLAPEAAAALRGGRLGAGLYFSPRSAALWAGLVRSAGLAGQTRTMRAACLSEAVAASLDDLAFACVRIAPSRDQKALVRCLEGWE